MTETADTGLIAKLANAADEFRQYYEKLTDYRWGARIARSGDVQLMHDYGKAVNDAESIKRKIESVTGAWQNIKEWAGLAALPLIPIVVAFALTATITGGVIAIKSFMRRADIVLAIRQDPKLTYAQAADQVDAATKSDFGEAVDVFRIAIYLGGAFLAYKMFWS